MSQGNMDLWNSISECPADWKKRIPGGGNLDAIDTYSRIRKATEVWGPAGVGWGWRILGEKLQEGLYCVHIELWYEDKLNAVEAVNACQYAGTRRSGDHFVDEDAPKKALTGAIMKALSYVGLCADVYLGSHADSEYRLEPQETSRDPEASAIARGLQTGGRGRNGPEAGREAPRASVGFFENEPQAPPEWQAEQIRFGKFKDKSFAFLSNGKLGGRRAEWCSWYVGELAKKVRASEYKAPREGGLWKSDACFVYVDYLYRMAEEEVQEPMDQIIENAPF